MTSNSMPYNLAVIRELLLASFTPEELRRFCSDRSVFQPVVNEFAYGDGLAGMVDKVLDRTQTQLLWDELLVGVKQVNPRQYRRYELQLGAQPVQSGPHDGQPIEPERATESSEPDEAGSNTTFNVTVSGGQVDQIISVDKLEGGLSIDKRK